MTQYLPPNLLALFTAREPIPYFPPLDKLPWEKKPWPYNGVSQFLNPFEVIEVEFPYFMLEDINLDKNDAMMLLSVKNS